MKRGAATFVTLVLAGFCMAPTAGDVGGCGATVSDLNAQDYAFKRKDLDCRRCGECGFTTARCSRACDEDKSPDTSVPATCKPVKHDGEVCLRVLIDASCETYRSYVADAPSTPSECEFCQYVPPGPLPGFVFDAGQNVDARAP